MPQFIQPIEYRQYYHIYNYGNNSCNIFFKSENYKHFLNLYSKYVNSIAETYAWRLLKNHFHFLIRIKDKKEMEKITINKVNMEKSKILNLSRQLGYLFNAYIQSMNKRYGCTLGHFI
ncbi:transposase [Flavobacterium oreochromis]|uniref:hypothetical protein n=1 Tax=Flavobacterium oreochromis TaxID=2906078 RepID=UPI001CE59C6F|nr:hypothetical protein [Flavobacterium oreochromis]QYS86163.1 transposase [Flavobacterium oreochromis]